MIHVVLTLAVFLLTLTLIFVRPWKMHEAWATVVGGALMLILRLESPMQAWRTTAQGGSVLAFLFALMLLSALLEKSGFFEWAAILSARAANGDGQALYRNVFLLGAVITAFLSLDTTAIILTPVVLAFVQRLKLTARPFLLACAFIANTASLLLPVSNLTNLLFQNAFHFSCGAFALRMAVPQIVAICGNYFVFRWLFRRELPKTFNTDDLPILQSVLPDVPFFRGAVAILCCVLIGYFIGSLRGFPPYAVALIGCAVLAIWGMVRRQIKTDIIQEISWPLFPFVVGLFVVIQGVENLGRARHAALGLNAVGHRQLTIILASAFGAGIGSNVINNIPMALLSISIVKAAHVSVAAQYGALLGCNLGTNLTLAGSLATMLVITSARKKGEDIRASEFLRAGLWTTPLLLFMTSLALWVTMLLWR